MVISAPDNLQTASPAEGKTADRSLMTAMIANVVVVMAGIFIFRPTAMTILWSFWCENIAIGILTAVYLLKLKDFTVSIGTSEKRRLSLAEKRRTAFGVLGMGAMFYFVFFNIIQGGSGIGSLNFAFIAASTGILFTGRLISFARGEFVRQNAVNGPPDLTHLVFAPLIQIILAFAAIFPGIVIWIFLSISLLFSGLTPENIDKTATNVTVLLLASAIKMFSDHGMPSLIVWMKKNMEKTSRETAPGDPNP